MNAIIVLILRLILLIMAYLFVGWIGYTIYKDLRVQFQDRPEATAQTITLRTSLDNNVIEKQFSQSEIMLGRDPDCDFVIPDETISLRHCQLTFHHKRWWANDMNSTNGSYLNDNLITTPVILTNGDGLRIGSVAIIIKFK